jgi:hypothetical protein
MPQDLKEIRLAGTAVRLRSPVDLRPAGRTGIDSTVSVFQGSTIEVTVDEGPFSDPLTGYGDRPDHRITEELVGSRPARVVSFRLEEDLGQFAGAHFEGLTIAVIGREDLGGDVPLQMVKSVRFVTRQGRANG